VTSEPARPFLMVSYHSFKGESTVWDVSKKATVVCRIENNKNPPKGTMFFGELKVKTDVKWFDNLVAIKMHNSLEIPPLSRPALENAVASEFFNFCGIFVKGQTPSMISAQDGKQYLRRELSILIEYDDGMTVFVTLNIWGESNIRLPNDSANVLNEEAQTTPLLSPGSPVWCFNATAKHYYGKTSLNVGRNGLLIFPPKFDTNQSLQLRDRYKAMEGAASDIKLPPGFESLN
jgi:hypothetical protein